MKTKIAFFGLLCILVTVLNCWLSFPSSVEMDASLSQMKGTGVVVPTILAHTRDYVYFGGNLFLVVVFLCFFAKDIVVGLCKSAKNS